MSFSWFDVWRMIKRWWWLAVISVVLAGGTSYHFASKKPNIYAARTRLMVGSGLRSLEPNSRDFSLSLTLAQAYSEVVRQQPIVQGVVERLGIPMEWGELAESIRTRVIPNAQLLEITFVHTDPKFAALAANALAEELILQSPASSQEGIDRDFIRQELADAQAKIRETEVQIEELRDDMLSFTSAAELEEARSRLEELEQLKLTYRSAYVEMADLLNTQSPNTLTVVEPSSPPTSPIAPSPKKEAAIAAVAGLTLALGAVLVLEFADDRLRIEETGGESVLGLPLLGTVPRIPGGHCEPRSPEAEMIRQLRTKVLLSSSSGRLKSLVVTSAQPKDGKTVIAANLGVVMAGGGAQVVLVDADLRAPTLHEWFDQPNLAGLADMLGTDRAHCEQLLPQLLRDTHVPGLSLISAGHLPLDPSILLASPNMVALLELLSSQFDFVVFDTPPVLAAPDATILSMVTEGTLIVLSPDRTSRRTARRARDILNSRNDIRVIGVALNRASVGHHAFPYYYHHDESPQPGYGTRLPRGMANALSFLPLVGRPKDPDLLSLSQAAAMLGVRINTVKRWCQEGRLPAVRSGFRWWVRQDELRGTLLQRLVAANSSGLLVASGGDGHQDSQGAQEIATASAERAPDVEPFAES